MGFFSFLKKVFSAGEDDAVDAELNAARARHGITVDGKKEAQDGSRPEQDNYDPWEYLRGYQANAFLGTWAARKFKLTGEDKVKAKLEALEKKRKEEEEEGRG